MATQHSTTPHKYDQTGRSQTCTQAIRFVKPTPRILPYVRRSWDHVEPKLRQQFLSLVEGIDRWPLYLHGPAGCGKTCAALALCDHVESAGLITVDELADDVMGRGNLLNHVAETQLLVIDELGTRQRVTDLHYTCLKQVIDLRARLGRDATVFISNLDDKQFRQVYDDRIVSRVLCGTWFAMPKNAVDRRFPQ